MARLITFLSDFGLQDSYVAEVKAVLLSKLPNVPVVDISHQVPSYNIEWAGFQLRRSYRYFPKGTVHLVVVDPGVGTNRRSLYVKTKHYEFVGPDNGVLAWAAHDCEKNDKKKADIFEIPVPKSAGPTFHGRDVFAPFVTHLLGKRMPALKKLKSMEGREFPEANKAQGRWVGEILGWDQFGNLVTSIPFEKCHHGEARVAGLRDTIPECPNYMGIEEGKVGLIRGSHGFWEISCRMGSAADLLRVKPGDTVTVFPAKSK